MGQNLKNLVALKGEVRGVALQTDANFILKTIGEEGLLKLQRKTKEKGYEIPYKNIKTMAWYPLGLRVVSLLAAKEAFSWNDDKIEEMGNSAPKHSFIASTMLRFFFSVPKVFQEAARYWKKHYTIGELEPLEIDEAKKFAILRLKEFKVHPILCRYYSGYFLRISQFVIKSSKIKVRETECPFKKGLCHQFLIKWE